MNKIARMTLSARQRLAAFGLVGLLIIGAVAEACLFLLLVPLAQAVATGNDTVNRRLGSFDAEASTSTLVWALAVFLLVLTAVRLVSVAVQTRLTASVERTERTRLFDAFLGAEWQIQAGEPLGRLQTIASFATAKADL